MKKAALALIIIYGFLNDTIAQTSSENLSSELSGLYEGSGLSGFFVSIVDAGGFLYKNNIGCENIETRKPFSSEQRFYIASISKTFIGIALMKLVEDGQLELTTPINTILPFQVINPQFTDTEITVEHLARHTSSILYGGLESKSWYLDDELELSKKSIGKTAYNDFYAWDKNGKVDLGKFLKECLSLDGKLYSKGRFSKSKPGENYEYSNLGAALAAYIIEVKTGVDYREYIENFVSKELGFQRGVWRSTIIEKLPTNYLQNKMKVPAHKSNLYPAGSMMLSGNELSIYLTEMIKGFQGKSQILDPKSFQKMMTRQNLETDRSGIFWELNGDKIGHNGGNYGVTCFMSFNKVTGIGKIFMTNISSYQNDELLKEMIEIWNTLNEYESKFK